ncbi:MAG: hypothetical protein GH158_04820 [Dehalococcoidia bacterium]|nr:hypothetical protein [Dehalococcoidia bacterium]
MTHSLHRRGTAESLSQDYVMLCLTAIGFNDENHDPKLSEFLRIALRHDPVNIGAISLGNMYSNSKEEVVDKAHGIVHAVFVKQDQVVDVLKDLEKAGLGMSVVVSGIFEKVDECLSKAGLKHHTANFSLGIWGKTEKLPDNDLLEVTTMCGHAMIAANLVKSMVDEVKAGRKTADEAAKVLAPQCACGIFNPDRAAKLLTAMAKK